MNCCVKKCLERIILLFNLNVKLTSLTLAMYQVPKRPLGNQSQQQFGHHNAIKSSESMLLSDSSKANFIRRKNDNMLIVVSFPEEVYPYFKYEHLASIYKSLLCNKSQEVGFPFPIYESYEVKEGDLNGWRGTCTYNNHVYNCIGEFKLENFSFKVFACKFFIYSIDFLSLFLD